MSGRSAHSADPLSRPPAFEALGLPVDRRRRETWLPFAAIAAIVLLVGGLFLAILAEDRQLQRESLKRDFDSAVLQLDARLTSLSEAVSAVALEIGAQTIGERRFAIIVGDLIYAKPEVQRVKYVNEAGRLVWRPLPAGTVPARPDDLVELGFLPLLERARQAPEALWGVLPGDERPAALALVVPVYTDGRFAGAVLLRVSATGLLRSLSAETLNRYRLQLLSDHHVIAATSATPAPANALIHTAALAPLPAQVRLQASAFRAPSLLTGAAPLWLIGMLSGAVAFAMVVLLRYTTRLVRADRAMLAETSLRRAMENSLATGLRVLDRDGVIRYVNKSFCQMTGWQEADLVGRAPPYPYWPPERIDEHQANLAQVLAGEVDAAGFETLVQRPDGSRFDARMYVSPLVDEDGAQIGWVTSMADITEHKRNRNELAAAHDRFTMVLESLQAAVSVVAADGDGGEPLFANRAYRQDFGQDTGGHHRLARELAAARAHPASEVQDRESGRWYDVRMRAIRWVDGRPAHLQIATDITLRKATDEIVRQQEEKVQFTSRLMTMGEMASSLAHELNQPLTAITNYSEGALARLKSGGASSDDVLPALEKTSAQAQRAGRIIRRIREFVKRSEPRRRPTPAARIVEDAVGFAEIEARKKSIAIAVAVEPGLPALDVDPILIEQVLLNLLKNAIDAMDRALVRRIDVEVRRASEGTAEIAVIDRGSGIPDAHVASLFQPFFSTKSEGMGMGLSICRSIVEFHRGRLSVGPNPDPGGGTIMRFTLPLAGEDLEQRDPPAVVSEDEQGAARP